ncbi:hypothetical protein WA026_016567 [Henosepilachna vigintioctopunctata]|uniref:Uncharacterized protein n=1 Tax=Henosepilachna vigintioctopunctata TaxID=420089 RepID=A0AAW1VEX8_9CUCU
MAAQPYIMQQAGGPDQMHSIINHKFFISQLSTSGGRVKTWTNNTFANSPGDYRQNNQRPMTNVNLRGEQGSRNQRDGYNSFTCQNPHFSSAQVYQNSYNPPSGVFQHQQNTSGPRNNYGGNTHRYNNQRFNRQNYSKG